MTGNAGTKVREAHVTRRRHYAPVRLGAERGGRYPRRGSGRPQGSIPSVKSLCVCFADHAPPGDRVAVAEIRQLDQVGLGEEHGAGFKGGVELDKNEPAFLA
ncbi:hypothetical protein PG984_013724 [Apiospora sp. TS-2023a]